MSDTDESTPSTISNRDVAKGAGTTVIARLGGVLDVLTQPLYVWLFGLAGYGFYGALWAAINLIENVADLGMTSAMQRVVPQAGSPQGEASALRASYLLALLPCIAIAVVIFLLAEPVAALFNAAEADAANTVRAVRWFVWALPLWAFVELSTSALRSKRLFGAEIRLRLFWEQVARLGFVLALYAAGTGTMALIYAHLMSLLLICLLCVRLMAKHFDLKLMFSGKVRDEVFTETLKAGLGVLPVNIVTRLFSDGPAIALNVLLPGSSGAVATSLYIIARKVSSLVQLVRTAFAYVLAPLAAAAKAGSGKKDVAAIYGFSTRLSFALALPLGAVLAGSGPVTLKLFGPGADAALIAVIILIAARVAEAVFGAATPIQQVTSAHLDQQLGSWIGIAVAVVIAWMFAPVHGLNAMAAAVAVGLVIAAVLPLFQLHIIDQLHPFQKPFASVASRSLLIALIGLAVTLLVQELPFIVQEVLLIAVLAAAWWFSWKLAISLIFAGIFVFVAQATIPAMSGARPLLVPFALLVPVLLATLWSALRFALPLEDRQALGDKTVRRMKLV